MPTQRAFMPSAPRSLPKVSNYERRAPQSALPPPLPPKDFPSSSSFSSSSSSFSSSSSSSAPRKSPTTRSFKPIRRKPVPKLSLEPPAPHLENRCSILRTPVEMYSGDGWAGLEDLEEREDWGSEETESAWGCSEESGGGCSEDSAGAWSVGGSTSTTVSLGTFGRPRDEEEVKRERRAAVVLDGKLEMETGEVPLNGIGVAR